MAMEIREEELKMERKSDEYYVADKPIIFLSFILIY